jgi:hypothetical protein
MATSNEMRRELVFRPLSDIETKPIVFLDKPIWQEAAFHLLVGRKNSGKGTWLAGEAARVTRGELGDRTHVIWIANQEDSYGIDVRPRIEAAGGIVENVTVVIGRLTLPDDALSLVEKAFEIGNVGMIVVDPLGGSLGKGKSSNIDSDVRDAFACLNAVADYLGCIVVGVRHVTNKETSNIISGVLGSSDWVNIPRVVLALTHDDEDEDLRHLEVITGNRVKAGVGRLYRIEGVDRPEGEAVTRAVHIGDSTKHADDLIKTPMQPASRSSHARDLILDLLEEAPGRQLESDALDAKVAEQTGLAVPSVRNLRVGLKNAGLIRNLPAKDARGAITGWVVARTNAPRDNVPSSRMKRTDDANMSRNGHQETTADAVMRILNGR